MFQIGHQIEVVDETRGKMSALRDCNIAHQIKRLNVRDSGVAVNGVVGDVATNTTANAEDALTRKGEGRRAEERRGEGHRK